MVVGHFEAMGIAGMSQHYFLLVRSHLDCTFLPDSRAAHSYVHSQDAEFGSLIPCNYLVDRAMLELAALVVEIVFVGLERTFAGREGEIVIVERAERISAVELIGIAEVAEHTPAELVGVIAIVGRVERTSEEVIVGLEKDTR